MLTLLSAWPGLVMTLPDSGQGMAPLMDEMVVFVTRGGGRGGGDKRYDNGVCPKCHKFHIVNFSPPVLLSVEERVYGLSFNGTAVCSTGHDMDGWMDGVAWRRKATSPITLFRIIRGDVGGETSL